MSLEKRINPAGAFVNGSAWLRALVNDGVPDMVDRLKERPDTFTGSRTNITFDAFPDVMRAYRAYAGFLKARQVSAEDAYSYIRNPWCKLGEWARHGLTFAYFEECFWEPADVSLVRSWAETRRQVMQVFRDAGEHFESRRGHGIDLAPGQVTFRELLRALDREGYRQVNSGDLRRYVLDVLERDGLLVNERPERRGQAGRLYLSVSPDEALEHLERLAADIGREHELQRARNVLDGKVRAKRRAGNVQAARDAQDNRHREAQIAAAAYARANPAPWASLDDLLSDLDVQQSGTAVRRSAENSYDEPII